MNWPDFSVTGLWSSLDWKAILGMIIIALSLFGLWLVFSHAWKRAGNAGEPSPCCRCGGKGVKYLPCIGRSWTDALFERSRRINGIAWSYRLDHDALDPRRLCVPHHREAVVLLEVWMDGARASLVTFNREQRATIPNVFDGVTAPEPATQPSRPAADSSIELEPLGEQT